MAIQTSGHNPAPGAPASAPPRAGRGAPGPEPAGTVHLGEILGALSHALDLTEGQPEGHCIRCGWIGVQIAAELGLSETETSELYYTILLKDLGCSSNAARICQLYLTDDLSFKKGFKTVDGSLGQALRFVIRHSGTNTNLADKFRTIFNVLRDSDRIIHEMMETRCHEGAEIATLLRFPKSVADGIQALDEHWDGGGRPYRLAGDDIPLYARVALLTQVVDVFEQEAGPGPALREARLRADRWFDPSVVAAFEACAARPGFWDGVRSAEAGHTAFALAHSQATQPVDPDYLDDIAHAFARVIDAKSPFTHGHSERVALYTDLICDALDYPAPSRRWMKRTALLHDLGKLGISNTVLDKPGKLDDAEFALMKTHPTLGHAILSRISTFGELAEVAAAHHERLDGKGYPKGRTAETLTRDMRVLAVADIFDALTAERPYRAALPLAKTYEIMDDLAGPGIDPDCYAALRHAVSRAEFLDLA